MSDEPGDEHDDELERRATEAAANAYAPYSKFKVGAAIRANGKTYAGVNVENASYPLTVCAERNALAAAVLDGVRAIEAVAVYTDAAPPSAPCGGCRQVLLELAPDPGAVRVTAVNAKGMRRSWTLAELIPDGFSGRELP